MKKVYIIIITILLTILIIQKVAYRKDVRQIDNLQLKYLDEIYKVYNGKVKKSRLEKVMSNLSSNNYKLMKYDENKSDDISQAFNKYKKDGFEDSQSIYTYIKSIKNICNESNCKILYIEIIPGKIKKNEEYTEIELKVTFYSLKSIKLDLKLYNNVDLIKFKM